MIDTRKPVAAVSEAGQVIVVCEDGSVFYRNVAEHDAEWWEGTPIPGSRAEAEDSN